jgi:hypothetical protein
MARRVDPWLAGLLGVCLAIGVVYLPPRGSFVGLSRRFVLPTTSQERRRAQNLAEEWRAAQSILRLQQYRERLEPALVSLRARDGSGPVLLVDGPDSATAPLFEVLRPALDTMWNRLGLGQTKVTLGVVVALPRGAPVRVTAVMPTRLASTTYLLPDSTDRFTCLALLPAPYFIDRLANLRRDRLEAWLGDAIGPCGFYARFGVPGTRVRAWLARRNYDLAIYPGKPRVAARGLMFDWLPQDNTNAEWYWGWLYALRSQAIGCLAGRPGDCRGAVRAGDGEFGDSMTRVVTPTPGWRVEKQRLLGGGWFLGEVARAVGDDRFLQFWRTDLPIDSALSLALSRPVGEWTAEWQRGVAPRPMLGPAAAFLSVVFGLVTALGALALLLAAAHRREVQAS